MSRTRYIGPFEDAAAVAGLAELVVSEDDDGPVTFYVRDYATHEPLPGGLTLSAEHAEQLHVALGVLLHAVA